MNSSDAENTNLSFPGIQPPWCYNIYTSIALDMPGYSAQHIFSLQAPSLCRKRTPPPVHCLQPSYDTMSPQSTAFSLIAIASLLSSSIALPLDVPQILPRSYSIVNVDGSSSPTTPSIPPSVTQTQTILDTVTAPGPTSISTVNVDSATETVYVTVASTPTPTPTPSAPLLPTIPSGFAYPPLNSNSTSSSNSLPSSSAKAALNPSQATSSEPCEPTPEIVGDGAPWRLGHGLAPTGTYPTAYATGSYNAPIAAKPSGMTSPLPILPPVAPYWFNITEIPHARRRIVVS